MIDSHRCNRDCKKAKRDSALTREEQKIAKALRRADDVLAEVLPVLTPLQQRIVKAQRSHYNVWIALDTAKFYMAERVKGLTEAIEGVKK